MRDRNIYFSQDRGRPWCYLLLPVLLCTTWLAGWSFLSAIAHGQLPIAGVGPTQMLQPRVALPNSWHFQDFGAASTIHLDNGAYTLASSQGDVWNKDDTFAYVYQPFHDNGSVTAHLVSRTSASDWSKVGIMIRQSTRPGSPYVFLLLSPLARKCAAFQWRKAGESSAEAPQVPTVASSAWLKVVRDHNLFTSYLSTDGQNQADEFR